MEDSILQANEAGFSPKEKDKWFEDKQYNDFIGFTPKESVYPSEIGNYLNEKVITLSYKAAIEINSEEFRDKTVLEINSSIGFFSLLAAQNGAKKVYSIEPNTSLSILAKKIVDENYYNGIIEIINKDIYDVELKDKVDIIICNWTGYFLLQYSYIKKVIYARDKFLNKDGIILPDKATLYITGIEDIKFKKNKFKMWDDAYGINMSCMRKESINAPLIDGIYNNKIISTVCPIYMVDIYTITENDLNFSSEYELEFIRDDVFSALAAWFDVEFTKMPNNIKFTTGPRNLNTRHRQTIFYNQDDVKVKKDDKLKGSICSRVNKKLAETNGLDIKISYHFDLKECDEKSKVNWVRLYKIAL